MINYPLGIEGAKYRSDCYQDMKGTKFDVLRSPDDTTYTIVLLNSNKRMAILPLVFNAFCETNEWKLSE